MMKLTSANANPEQPGAWRAQGSSAKRRYWLAVRSLLVLAVLAAMLLGLACGDDGRSRAGTTDEVATVVDQARVTPRILDLRVRSPALGKDAMVRLMTPVGWSSSSTSRRWPVLY